MRITVERDGGIGFFPGLNGPFSLDTEMLPADEAAALEATVRGADFAAASQPPPGSADMRSVTITVEDGGSTRTVTVVDPPEDPALGRLVARLTPPSPA